MSHRTDTVPLVLTNHETSSHRSSSVCSARSAEIPMVEATSVNRRCRAVASSPIFCGGGRRLRLAGVDCRREAEAPVPDRGVAKPSRSRPYETHLHHKTEIHLTPRISTLTYWSSSLATISSAQEKSRSRTSEKSRMASALSRSCRLASRSPVARRRQSDASRDSNKDSKPACEERCDIDAIDHGTILSGIVICT